MSAIVTALRRSSCQGFKHTHLPHRPTSYRSVVLFKKLMSSADPITRSNCTVSNERKSENASMAKPKVLVISGPTAVGKSALALELAQRLGGEIISCDSVQVYRGLNIGSAKTPVSERRGIPHHLLDIKDPSEEYTAGDFYQDARAATEDVIARGKLPVVVGGTGLYLRWFIHGTPETPKASPELAAEIEAKIQAFQGQSDGWQAAVAFLTESGDPRTGAELAPNDWYRMRRALEIVLASGKPKSEFGLNFVKAPHVPPPRKPKRRRAAGKPADGLSGAGPGVGGIVGQSPKGCHQDTDTPPSSRTETLLKESTFPQSQISETPSNGRRMYQNETPSSEVPESLLIRSRPDGRLEDTPIGTSSSGNLATTPNGTPSDESLVHSSTDTPSDEDLLSMSTGTLSTQTPETPSPSGRELDYDFRCYFLFGPRRDLYRKIDERCEQMAAGGLLEEASALLDVGIRADTCMPSRAIGYRQALEYLEECRSGVRGGRERFLRFLEEFQQASRRYAKRQLTWFRSEGSFLWLDASRPTAELADRISTELTAESSTLDAKKGLIPDSWLSRDQERELKAYKTERKIFHDDAAIARVLKWVEETQRGQLSAPGDALQRPLVESRGGG